MRTTTPLVTLAVVTLMIVLWPSGSSARYAQDALAPNAEFARQWREVRAKYPLVAVAYLQSVEALSQEIAQQAPERRAAMESAVRLGVTTATQGMTIKACAPCKMARNMSELDGYIGCLGTRIACLKP